MQQIVEDFKKAYISAIDKNKHVFIYIMTNMPDTIIPDSLRNTGNQSLNISPKAVRHLDFGPKYIEFKATFDHIPETCSIPYDAIHFMTENDV